MSDGPSTSAINDTPIPSPPATETAGLDGLQTDDETAPRSATEKSQDPAVKKRDDFLLELVIALDTLVYIELAALYYLDTSTFLLLLRALLHFSQVTIPHVTTQNLPAALMYRKPPLTTPNTPLLLAASLICFAVHAFTSAPIASELTRFHLHGGLIVDFVGQYAIGGLWARARLCVLDILVVLVQGLTCAVAIEKARGAKQVSSGVTVSDYSPLRFGTLSDQRVGSASGTRSVSVSDFDPAAVELQPLDPQGRRVLTTDGYDQREQQEENGAGDDSVLERERLLSSQPGSSGEGTDDLIRDPGAGNDPPSRLIALETLYSGQTILAELHLVDMVRNAFWEQRNRRLRGTV